jgi:hypothetical protein
LPRHVHDSGRQRWRGFPPIKRVSTASNAAAIFSLIIKFASSPASLPPRVNFVSRRPMTRCDSITSIVDEYHGNMSFPHAGHAASAQQHADPMVPETEASSWRGISSRCLQFVRRARFHVMTRARLSGAALQASSRLRYRHPVAMMEKITRMNMIRAVI